MQQIRQLHARILHYGCINLSVNSYHSSVIDERHERSCISIPRIVEELRSAPTDSIGSANAIW